MSFYPIRFQDANFEHIFACRKSSIEGIHKRYIPIGMPRLNPYFQNTAFFLYGINPKTGKLGTRPKGTGVLVGFWGPKKGIVAQANRDIRHIYAVTCQHVAPDGASTIRINTNDGKSRFIEFEPHEWQFMPNGDDIAAVDITDRLKGTDSFSAVPPNLFATPDFFKEYEFGIGEDGFMLGLFADIPGKYHNMVAARFGNVSLLADKEELIKQGNNNKRPSHIFDMHSRPGFSGSPIFVYRTPSGDIRNIAYGPPFKFNISGGLISYSDINPMNDQNLLDQLEERQNTFIKFFGIHSGQYGDKVKAYKETTAETDEYLKDGDILKVPNSMTVVVPAWEVMNLLNLPIFVGQRNKREEEDRKNEENAAEPESIRTGDDSANPSHKEDFTRLVSAATKKQ